MKNWKILIAAALVGIGVAITYFYFEYAVKHSTAYVWQDVFNTNTRRFLVLPLSLVLTFLYFGAQHLFDPALEKKESHGLGESPPPMAINFVKVLGIGFLSLLAGASLGPEAILVPACILLGQYTGEKALHSSKSAVNLLGAAGLIALMAAFFNSFILGVLSLMLIKKQMKARLTPLMIAVGVVASGSTTIVLGMLKNSAYVALPKYDWNIDIGTIFILAVLAVAGYGLTYGLRAAHDASATLIARLTTSKPWWLRSLIAAGGLSVLYWLGGPLVQFTGNESIIPMLQRSASLGFWGLAWILIVKLFAIGWSKAGGYRGGLIFPTVFGASVIIAIAKLYVHDINLIYALIIVMAGVIIADSKAKFLL